MKMKSSGNWLKSYRSVKVVSLNFLDCMDTYYQKTQRRLGRCFSKKLYLLLNKYILYDNYRPGIIKSKVGTVEESWEVSLLTPIFVYIFAQHIVIFIYYMPGIIKALWIEKTNKTKSSDFMKLTIRKKNNEI